MNRFDSYKNSGIDWVSEIPKDWLEIKVKYIANIVGRIGFRGYTTSDLVPAGEGAISLSPGNIRNQNLTIEKNTYLSWEKYHESPEIQIFENDIVVVKTGSTIGKIAIIPKVEEKMTLNPQLVVLKNIKVENKFLYYVMVSKYFQNYFKLFTAGGSTPAISQEKINNFSLVIPESKEVQLHIATYLDKKTTKIDNLISKKERLIELLEEEKTAVINRAVTKGLNPNVLMKESGVEWLGEIPEHWGFSRLKFYSKNKTGTTPNKIKKDYWENGSIPWMSSGEVNQKKISKISKRITKKAFEETSLELFPPGSIMIAMNGQGKTKGTVGILETETTFNQSLTAFHFNDLIKSSFIFYYLDSKYQQLRGLVGEDRDGLSSAILKNVYFPIPPIQEQNAIVNSLEKTLSKKENLRLKQRKQIEYLKEYKTALISQVVTGKVDVRCEVLAN